MSKDYAKSTTGDLQLTNALLLNVHGTLLVWPLIHLSPLIPCNRHIRKRGKTIPRHKIKSKEPLFCQNHFVTTPSVFSLTFEHCPWMMLPRIYQARFIPRLLESLPRLSISCSECSIQGFLMEGPLWMGVLSAWTLSVRVIETSSAHRAFYMIFNTQEVAKNKTRTSARYSFECTCGTVLGGRVNIQGARSTTCRIRT